jgi:phospholipid N-methyltransferase
LDDRADPPTAPNDPLQRELQSFQGIWKGGYAEGNPLDPMGASSYGTLGYMSVLHAIYLACIRPYINPKTVVLEIGPGRGAWTRTMLAAREVWAMDALSAEHNCFWEHVGRHPHVRYIRVSDFTCSDLPDNHFDFLFSFGCLCHVSFGGIEAYMTNLWPKLRAGARAMVLIADYDKYNWASRNQQALDVRRALPHVGGPRWDGSPLPGWDMTIKDPHEDTEPSPGRWYHAGLPRTTALLERLGYEIVTADVGVCHRDPIIHFRKP